MNERQQSQSDDFHSFRTKVGRCTVAGKTVLIPGMAPFTAQLMAAGFRAYDIPAAAMETCRDPQPGRSLCSGKECLPCQVTLGDIVSHLRREKARLGRAFSAGDYVYFMPTSDGPCRFGMYSKFQRLALDRLPDLQDVSIACFSAEDAYSASGIMPERHAYRFKRLLYIAMVIADAMDRMVWRVRPYETSPGLTNTLMAGALSAMISAVETSGSELSFRRLYRLLGEKAASLASAIDTHQPRRPRIGVVGEIYLRSHTQSNHDIVQQIERFGGEVVVSSIAEWLNYVAYCRAMALRRRVVKGWHHGRFGVSARCLAAWLAQNMEGAYWSWQRKRVYKCVLEHLDIHPDHEIRRIEEQLDHNRLFSFELGSEAPLTIGAALEYAREGFDGIVNVFPFTCMPGAASTAILEPELRKLRLPCFSVPCDGTIQPNRETALRTFMYQAQQHRTRGQGL
jgi:predicted nucleotide-binding protein (sugar kinase/HSP70/actin superfamily)